MALGAKIVERHVTLDKTWKGSDHAASLEPSELAELVRSIRLVERALGSGVKRMLPCEKPCHDKVTYRLWLNVAFKIHGDNCVGFFFKCCVASGFLFFSNQLGKSVVAKTKIPKGTVLTADMLAVKVAEPMGVKAEDIFELVGNTMMENVEEDESIVPELVDSYGKKAKC